MNKTKIEWVKSPDGSQGYTWNPITGCLNCTPQGLCKGGMFPCYAYKLANGRLKNVYTKGACELAPLPNNYLAKSNLYPHTDPFYPRFWEDRLEPVGLTGGSKRPHSYGYLTCYKDHKPKGVFVCDMSDLFGIGIPEAWTQKVMDTIRKCSAHRFYLLTKQPQNLIKFSPFPDNCWVGITATNDLYAIDAINSLIKVKAKVTFLNLEPLLYWGLEAIDTGRIVESVDWVIIGAQTKPYKPPKIEWVKEIVEACDKAGIPVFLKENLAPIIKSIKGQNFYLRQQMPGDAQWLRNLN